MLLLRSDTICRHQSYVLLYHFIMDFLTTIIPIKISLPTSEHHYDNTVSFTRLFNYFHGLSASYEMLFSVFRPYNQRRIHLKEMSNMYFSVLMRTYCAWTGEWIKNSHFHCFLPSGLSALCTLPHWLKQEKKSSLVIHEWNRGQFCSFLSSGLV